MKNSILDMNALEQFRKEEKLQPFRIKQIYHNIFKNSIIDFDEMTDLSKDLRKKLKERFYIVSLQPEKILDSHDTTKIAFKNQK
jgi:23S rRNA (adenine2503-C2)-methyltransferase